VTLRDLSKRRQPDLRWSLRIADGLAGLPAPRSDALAEDAVADFTVERCPVGPYGLIEDVVAGPGLAPATGYDTWSERLQAGFGLNFGYCPATPVVDVTNLATDFGLAQ
jgi:hypothetical protein